MRIDIGNALAAVASPGISESALTDLDDRVQPAHERMMAGMESGDHGYAALGLPATVDPDEIETAVARLTDHQEIILAGIGGSALGAATIADALGTGDRLHVLDNVDPQRTAALLESVELENAALFVVSRSGTTTETIANATLVANAMETAGIEWTDRTLVITGDDGPLRTLATEHGLSSLPVPDGVPGRYSALSTMGLPVAEALGHDIRRLLDGGSRAVDGLEPSLFDSPAYAFGAVSYALAERGARVNAMMPYAEGLETFAEWFAQLWAESLGKGGTGQVPARALGATDQHSQLQLYRAGPPIVQTTFLAVDDLGSATVPADGPIDPGESLRGRSLEELLETMSRATEASVANAGRPTVRLEIERLDESALGELLMTMEAACMLAGDLFEINPFDQPAVDWSKRATRALLRGDDTLETRAIHEKTEWWIETE